MMVVMTGRPTARASMITTGNPSAKLGRTSARDAKSSSRTSVDDIHPVMRTILRKSSSLIRCSICGRPCGPRSSPDCAKPIRSRGWNARPSHPGSIATLRPCLGGLWPTHAGHPLLCAHDPAALSAVRRILVRAVSGYYERTAKRLSKPLPRTGAVAFVQRFDSALRLNVHLHVLWLDGVYSHEPGRGGVEWCEHAQVTDADVALLVRRVRDRVRRKLRQMGKWPEVGDAADAGATPDASDGEQLLLELVSAAVQGVAVQGERAGQRDVRVGRGARDEPFVKGVLCADLDGFSLHAAVRVAAGNRRQLEYLCRYAARPAIAESRLSLLPDGRVSYELKKRWKDGTTHVVLTAAVLIERLLALGRARPQRVALGAETSQAPGDVAWRAGTGCESAFMDRAATGGGRWG